MAFRLKTSVSNILSFNSNFLGAEVFVSCDVIMFLKVIVTL